MEHACGECDILRSEIKALKEVIRQNSGAVARNMVDVLLGNPPEETQGQIKKGLNL